MTVLESFSLSGKIALVTGSNTGLGRGMALGLAEAGADVACFFRTKPGDTPDLIQSMGRKAATIQGDLSRMGPEEGERVVRECREKMGGLDILVNNAGMILRRDAVDFDESDWDTVMNTNLKSLFFLSTAAARTFRDQGRGGKIVNIASMLSFQGGIRVSSYTASKHGVMGLTRILANEWAAHGVQVNAIAPGYMATNNTEALQKDPKRSAEILARIPAGRWGTPDDLKGAVVFLSSSASNYVTGYTIAVDGGWLAR